MDRVTAAMSQYVKAKGISVQAISAGTGISYGILQPSFAGRRKLRADEFLGVCEFLEVNPKQFSLSLRPSINVS